MPDDRIAKIDLMQQALEAKVGKLQAKLFALIVDRAESLYKDPEQFERLFKTFNNTYHQEAVTQFGNDLLKIGEFNSDYFAELTEMSTNAFTPIKRQVGEVMLKRFGLTIRGKLVEGGFLDSFIQDTSVKRQIKQYMYKAKSSAVGLSEFSKGLRSLIVDNEQNTGLLSRYYRQYTYDTYTLADREFQEGFATRLELDAFIYAGGTIRDSRPFCKERNGKVILRSETEAWKKLSFAGKPKNYNPLSDLGGYGCRHSKNYLTNEQAVRRRDDLEIVEGKLRVKPS